MDVNIIFENLNESPHLTFLQCGLAESTKRTELGGGNGHLLPGPKIKINLQQSSVRQSKA